MATVATRRSFLTFRNGAIAVAVIVATIFAFEGLRYFRLRSQLIDWDKGSIELLYGGPAEEDHIRKVEFIREWEYRALKRTSDGKDVWLHVKLTDRHCGNWTLVDPEKFDLVRPLEVRYPDGMPRRRGGFTCFGAPID